MITEKQQASIQILWEICKILIINKLMKHATKKENKLEKGMGNRKRHTNRSTNKRNNSKQLIRKTKSVPLKLK